MMGVGGMKKNWKQKEECMPRSAMFVLIAVVASLSTFGTGAMAAEHGAMATSAHIGNLVNWFQSIFGTYGGYQHGTVPIPGTLLTFAAGFMGFAAWRTKRSQE